MTGVLKAFINDLVLYVSYGLLVALVVVWIFSETYWMHALAALTAFFLVFQFAKLKK